MTRSLPLLLLISVLSLAVSRFAASQDELACGASVRPDKTTGHLWAYSPATAERRGDSSPLSSIILKHEGWPAVFQRQCQDLAPNLDFSALKFFSQFKTSANPGVWNERIDLAENICSGRPLATTQKSQIPTTEFVEMSPSEKVALMSYSDGTSFACCNKRKAWINVVILDGEKWLKKLSELHQQCAKVIKAKKAELLQFNRDKILGAVVDVKIPAEDSPPEDPPLEQPVDKKTPEASTPPRPSGTPEAQAPKSPETKINNDRLSPVFNGNNNSTSTGNGKNGSGSGGKGAGCNGNCNTGEDTEASASNPTLMVTEASARAAGEKGPSVNGLVEFDPSKSIRDEGTNERFLITDRRFFFCWKCHPYFVDGDTIANSQVSGNALLGGPISDPQDCIYDKMLKNHGEPFWDAFPKEPPSDNTKPAFQSSVRDLTQKIMIQCSKHLGRGPGSELD